MQALLSFPYFPFLLGIYPVLLLFANNSTEVSFSEVAAPFFLVFAASLVVFFLFSYVFRGRTMLAAMASALCLLIIFFYGHVFEYLERQDIYIQRFRHLQIIPLSFACVFYLVFFLRKLSETAFRSITPSLNLMLLLLVSYNTGVILFNKYVLRPAGMSENRSVVQVPEVKVSVSDHETEVKPDVYYIVLDEFASFNSIESEYGYRNDRLIEYFERKGFIVTSESRSGFVCTWKSLDTVLNMEYPPPERTPLEHYERILSSRVSRTLQEMGYAFVYNSDQKLYTGTYENPYAEYDLRQLKKNLTSSALGFSNFTDMLLRTSILRPWYLYRYSLQHGHRYNELIKLETFGEALQVPSPKFVFSHHLISHEPFVFDENGGYVPYHSQYDWTDKKNYLGVYKFQTMVLIEMLDKIFSAYEVPPVIIVQSDHGIRKGVFGPRGDKMVKARLREEIETSDSAREILSAFFFPPDMQVSGLKKDLPPVETFQVVLPLLEKDIGIRDSENSIAEER
jgi:hypothetical protein